MQIITAKKCSLIYKLHPPFYLADVPCFSAGMSLQISYWIHGIMESSRIECSSFLYVVFHFVPFRMIQVRKHGHDFIENYVFLPCRVTQLVAAVIIFRHSLIRQWIISIPQLYLNALGLQLCLYVRGEKGLAKQRWTSLLDGLRDTISNRKNIYLLDEAETELSILKSNLQI